MTDAAYLERSRIAGEMGYAEKSRRRLRAALDEWGKHSHRAACRGTGWDPFFDPGSSRGEQYAEARAMCARCPVVAECLAFSYSSEPTRSYGFYGGMTPEERRQARKRKRIA